MEWELIAEEFSSAKSGSPPGSVAMCGYVRAVLRVLVKSASLPEQEGAKKVLHRVHDTQNQVKRLNII